MAVFDFVFAAVAVLAAGIRMGDAEEIAKLGQGNLAVGAFERAGARPAGDERVGGGNRHGESDAKGGGLAAKVEKGSGSEFMKVSGGGDTSSPPE